MSPGSVLFAGASWENGRNGLQVELLTNMPRGEQPRLNQKPWGDVCGRVEVGSVRAEGPRPEVNEERACVGDDANLFAQVLRPASAT